MQSLCGSDLDFALRDSPVLVLGPWDIDDRAGPGWLKLSGRYLVRRDYRPHSPGTTPGSLPSCPPLRCGMMVGLRSAQ